MYRFARLAPMHRARRSAARRRAVIMVDDACRPAAKPGSSPSRRRPIPLTGPAASRRSGPNSPGGGWTESAFGGYSVMCYRYVTGAGTYTLSLERTGEVAYPDDPDDPYGCIVAFWAGPENPGYP